MRRTPEDRERFRRLLAQNEAARRELQAVLDRVEARLAARNDHHARRRLARLLRISRSTI